MQAWLILTSTLPTHPSALRVRVWRALKSTGAGALREGVYLLPASASTAAALWDIERTIVEAGAAAHMLEVTARDRKQDKAFRALFDRAGHYADLQQSIREARRKTGKTGEAEQRRTLRVAEQQYEAVRAIDFFAGGGAGKVAEALAAWRHDIDRRFSPGEPARSAALIGRLAVADHQGRIWATRKRPWVDRLATAWLVRRFIDKKPKFVWLAHPAKCPKQALGYDFDGATFTHVGERVTFEVVAASFGLDEGDAALRRVGELVRAIDVGGSLLDEAPGLELVVRGLQARHADDDALLAAALPVFDAVHAAMRLPP